MMSIEPAEVAARLKQVRTELYGRDGIPMLARRLGIPEESWAFFEQGVQMPALTLLEFLVITNVDPRWLASGRGSAYRRAD